MATASIEKFVTLRAKLVKEKAALEAQMAALESRLARINAALDGSSLKSTRSHAVSRRGRRRTRNKLTLKAAVLQATRVKPLTRREALAAVENLGYKFATKNPLNSLGVVLYNKKLFKSQNGKYSPVK